MNNRLTSFGFGAALAIAGIMVVSALSPAHAQGGVDQAHGGQGSLVVYNGETYVLRGNTVFKIDYKMKIVGRTDLPPDAAIRTK